ncbi:MAG TPA: UDP-N-acetylglucosamine--LPS N-acetylglucosamine transferase [Myxococcota bacterium]|nr:UDP-N-acetylglucosamine--LPS N-acetylglucosamine transferase [Myxococcota bacterium]
MSAERLRLLLVASSGGHLAHLLWLRPWWEAHDRAWVTFDTPDARGALAGERVTWAFHPTNRSPINLARNAALAARTLAAERFDALVTTGAGVAVPFVLAARARGVPTAFIEVYDRVDGASLTGRLLAGLVDELVLQWDAQRAAYGRGVVLGPIR